MKVEARITHKHAEPSESYSDCIDMSLGWECDHNIDMDSFIEIHMKKLGCNIYQYKKIISQKFKHRAYKYELLFVVREDIEGDKLRRLTTENIFNDLVGKIHRAIERAVPKIGSKHGDTKGLLGGGDQKQIGEAPKGLPGNRRRLPG